MNAWTHIAGWTLVHFAWQGVVIALAAAAAVRTLRAARANTRYGLACAALAAMLVAPITTAVVLAISPRVIVTGSAPAPTSAASPVRVARPDQQQRAAPAASPALEALRLRADSWMAAIVWVWQGGVLLLMSRTAGAWYRVRRLHRATFGLPVSTWQQAGERIARRLGVRDAFRIVDSSRIQTPTMIGWLRPVIVLPLAGLSNLTPAQVEAVLAHELAHIRRHDYAINLLQAVAETLLFYHPAVWWVSGRIRVEREYCCDDVAVELCGDAVGYAEALAELESRRTGCAALAMAATGGSLLARVRRILGAPADDERGWPGALIALGVVLLCTVAAAAFPRHESAPPLVLAGPGTVASPAQVFDVVVPQAPSLPPAPGPPPFQIPSSPWRTLETMRFDIFYTPGLDAYLQHVAAEAERAYERVSADLRYDLSFKPALILYATREVLTQAVTSGTVAGQGQRILISVDTPADVLPGELAHEITHAFEHAILPRSVSSELPGWVSEGLAEYERREWAAAKVEALTQLVRTDAVPRITAPGIAAYEGNRRLVNSIGQAAYELIESQWGKEGIRQFLVVLRRQGYAQPDSVFRAALGVTGDEFENRFQAYVRARFAAR